MRVAQYVRVSSHEQNSALQKAEMDRYIADRGWQCVEVYEDHISGAKSSRPGLNRLMEDAKRRRFAAVLVWKLDRFGRSLVDCLKNIEALEERGVVFIATTQNLNTSHSDSAGRFLLHILGAAAEFERSLIRDRVHAGIKQAKRDGKRLGRPRTVFNRDLVHKLRDDGLSIREICARMDLSIGTVSRTLQEGA